MTARHAHPSVFMVLILPFGVMSGYLTVTLGYLLAHAGVPVERIAALIALSYLPHTWKFVWAPIADTTLTRKAWYVIAGTLSAAGIWATGLIPDTTASLPLLSTVVLVSNFAVTFLGMSVESLMADATSATEKGRAGGWFQAGNLGGQGIGGGAGVYLAQHLSAPPMAGAVLSAGCLCCCLALVFVVEPPFVHRERTLGRSLLAVLRDLWAVARSRTGFLALVLCVLPIGSGAASNLWSALAGEWHASANTVALVTGVLGGVVSAAGCIVGGWVCDRMPRRTAYASFGVLQGVCAVGMGFTPRTESTYIVFTTLYAFITGLTYAGFSAFVLEAMGMGAAATKYSLFASLSNTPIWFMTEVDGRAHTRWGPAGMLFTEAALGAVGVVAFIAVAAAMRPRRPPAAG